MHSTSQCGRYLQAHDGTCPTVLRARRAGIRGYVSPLLGDRSQDSETVSDLPKDTQLVRLWQGFKYRSSVSKPEALSVQPLPSQGKPNLGTLLSLDWQH